MNYFYSLLNAAAIYGSLAALQVLLLNRMGLAFAAIPLFAGIGAYALAAWSLGVSASAGFLLLAFLSAVGMAVLSNRLREDHYLLATLATLECLGAIVGLSEPLGGREGLPLPAGWTVGGRGFETSMLFWTLGTLTIICVAIRIVLSLDIGAAIDRLRENAKVAERYLPATSVRSVVVSACVVTATAVGLLYLAYHGRVSPTIFSLDFALLVLAFTVMAGRLPELAALAALLYWVFPYWLTKVFPLSQQGAADVVRFCWGALLIAAVLTPSLLHTYRQRRRRT